MIKDCHTRSVHGPRLIPNNKQYSNYDVDFDVEDDLDNDEDWKASKEDERLLKADEDFLSFTTEWLLEKGGWLMTTYKIGKVQ